MIYAIVLSVIAGTLGLYYFLFKDWSYFKKHGIPHVKPCPIVGNTGPIIFCRQSIADFVKSMYNLCPDAKYIGMQDLKNPIVMLRDPELIKSVMSKHFDMFTDRIDIINESQDSLFGKNLIVLRGERWREVRHILTPAFSSSKMKSMFKLMSDYGVNFSGYLAQLPLEKRTMEMKNVFMRCTSDVIAICAFGVNVDSMRNPKNDFYTYSTKVAALNSFIFLKLSVLRALPWLARVFNMKLLPDKMANFFRELIKAAVRVRNENGIVRSDVLKLMMENRSKDGKAELTVDDMVAQAFIFFFGGFETISTSMCFVAYEIAMNENVQKRLQNEIDQVLEDTNGQVSYEAINGMEYLDAVINEILRMYPVNAMVERLCLKDFELSPALPGAKPFILKKGHGIWIPIYGLQRDPKYFKDPERFDPERFLGERKKDSLNCGAYLPFGLGPRMCIGTRFALLKMKVLFFYLLARCELNPCEKISVPIKFLKNSFNMKPEHDFRFNVTPRKDAHHSITI